MAVLALLATLVAAPSAAPPACLALGTCCCTLANGTQCCARSGNCASGAVPGCACAGRG
jgi:hypothetical protein